MESWGGSAPPLMNRLRVAFRGESILGKGSNNGHVSFGNRDEVSITQNGSAGQTTLLDRSSSKFCVEPRSQSPDISHMSQTPILKRQT